MAQPSEPVPAFANGFIIEDDQTIVILGSTNALESGREGYLETALTTAYPQHKLRFRNMAWQADTVYQQQRPRNFYSIDKPEYGEPDDRQRTTADIVFFWFGQSESLDGEERVINFAEAYSNLLAQIKSYTGRIVLVTPVPFSQVKSLDLDVRKRNQSLAAYVEAIRRMGREKKLPVVDLFRALQTEIHDKDWSRNGLHLSSFGHWLATQAFATQLGVAERISHVKRRKADATLKPDSIENLRQAIKKKNALWSSYWRPTNWAFLYGNRQSQPSSRDYKNPEIRWFPDELFSLYPLIEEAEVEIFNLRPTQTNR